MTNFSRLLNVSVRITFSKLQVKGNFVNVKCLCENRSHCKNISKEKIANTFLLSMLLTVKKLVGENSVKYVNQMGNFHFRPKLKAAISLPKSNLFQWCLFTWEISLGSSLKPKNRNLTKISHLKVYSNLKQPHKLY